MIDPRGLAAVLILWVCAGILGLAILFVRYVRRCLNGYRDEDNAIRAELLERATRTQPPQAEGAAFYVVYVVWLHCRGVGKTVDASHEDLKRNAKNKLAKMNYSDLIALQSIVSHALPVQILVTVSEKGEATVRTY